jgi:HAD superfamily hydrolase (TIGR01509 family)
MIEAVLFDWGGTLSPNHRVDLLAIWSAAAAVLAPERADELTQALVLAEDELWAQTRATMGSFTTELLLRRALTAVGVEADDASRAVAIEAYRGGWSPYNAARPEAVTVVGALRQRGLRTGLLSNTNWPGSWHDEILSDDGLLELIDVRVYSSELSHMKPHPSAFAALLDAVGTTADRAVFVGDRLHDDIFGAKAVGMRAVWIRNDLVPPYDVDPDATIDSLSELIEIVDRWA